MHYTFTVLFHGYYKNDLSINIIINAASAAATMQLRETTNVWLF